MQNAPFTFFGSSRFSVIALDELAAAGMMPACVVTTPDRPKGRGLVMTPTPAKEWALAKGIPVLDPEQLDDAFIAQLKETKSSFAIVASYGKIIPQAVLDALPDHFLNIHPSLLPAYRGASPLQSAMLDDTKQTGVTVMIMDAKMDHGALVAQERVDIGANSTSGTKDVEPAWTEWPTYEDFEDRMARIGARLLARSLSAWLDGSLKPQPQDHTAATFTKKIAKEDALLDVAIDPKTGAVSIADQYLAFRKIQAFHEWPRAYFIISKNEKPLRVKIAAASFANQTLQIERVIPEGSKEMAFADFVRGYVAPRS